jgi:hypothetical protein
VNLNASENGQEGCKMCCNSGRQLSGKVESQEHNNGA